MNRNDFIRKAGSEVFDLCIIGGGITGAGLLAIATEKNLKAILVEKNDFASGTSSRSSKVIHGGLRYLKNLQFSLVKEALYERGELLKIFPELVRTVPFVFPSYGSTIDMLSKSFMLFLYDLLSGQSVIKPHRKLSSLEITELFPGLNRENLRGGIQYWEGITNDASLTIDVIASCTLHNQVALNYVEVEKIVSKGDRVETLQCVDKISGQTLMIEARHFINATGVWTDDVINKIEGGRSNKMKPSKGIHVVVDKSRLPSNAACIIRSFADDNRYLYLLPWEKNLVILGNTDTEFSGDPERLQVERHEVDYILNAFNHAFPALNMRYDDILSVYAGLRPLLSEGNKSSYERSREYGIWKTKENFINIAGGKYTSFLSMARRCIRMLEPIGGTGARQRSIRPNFESATRSLNAPGDRLPGEKLQPNPWQLTNTEIEAHIRHRYAEFPEDILTRRTTITYGMKTYNERFVEEVTEYMASLSGKDDQWMKEQQNKYYQHWLLYHPSFLVQTV